ncbi:MAG: formate dehydrogenase accessory sulfurtransferase FdhD, partial [Desulfobulbaceae bacterium]|nr:formate dehydrogenase accessory sulfurtransferase FdhD [Desulfobulbaceae bacterium]
MIDESVVSPVIKIRGRFHHECTDAIVREIPVTLHYNKEEIVTVLCSPNHIKELMIGFLISEGFVQDRADIYSLGYHCEENIVRVEGKERPLQKERMNRRVMSACCGKSRASFNFENDSSLLKVQESKVTLSFDHAVYYANYLDKNSTLFKETGGIHNGGVAYAGEVL